MDVDFQAKGALEELIQQNTILIHLFNQASWTHVGPGLVDVIETGLATGGLLDSAPSRWYINEGRPEAILALVID
jgi:hypothetical protein